MNHDGVIETCRIWAQSIDSAISIAELERRCKTKPESMQTLSTHFKDVSIYITACGFIAMGWTAANDGYFEQGPVAA